jgi:hypothetical protein
LALPFIVLVARVEVCAANKKELVTDLVVKAKQVEYLIKSLPEPEPEEEQVRYISIINIHKSNSRNIGEEAASIRRRDASCKRGVCAGCQARK